jgi:hypothetical protein
MNVEYFRVGTIDRIILNLQISKLNESYHMG